MPKSTQPRFSEKAVPIDALLLDPNNYRFQDSADFVITRPNRYHDETVQQKAAKRLRDESLTALKNSILANGFLPVERLVVTPYAARSGKYVAVEGNRRVATLKWIAEDKAAGVEIPAEVATTLQSVPVLVVNSDQQSVFREALMGIRHVSGVKQWGGYQRAKLVAALRDEHELESADIAARLGMSTREVNRRYRAFKALEHMGEAEDYADFANAKLYPIFHEAIASTGVRDWLAWDNDKVAFKNTNELNKFYELITPRASTDDDDDPLPPKITTYEQVRELDDVLGNAEAKRILTDSKRTLYDAVSVAKRDKISKAWRQEVASVLTALKGINTSEARELGASDIAELEKLRDFVNQLIEDHNRLTAKPSKTPKK